jgi:hypothetical protein
LKGRYNRKKFFFLYLLTYKLSENHIETFFCAIRSKGFQNTLTIQSDQQESKSEQALQIIGHVVAKSYAHKRSKHGRRQFMDSNAT